MLNVKQNQDLCLAGQKMLNIWASPFPFQAERSHFSAPAGLSVTEMLEYIGITPQFGIDVHVFIDGEPVPPHYWDRVKPKSGDHIINVRAAPGKGGGGKSPLRLVLTLAVFAASAWAAAAWASTLAGGLGLSPTFAGGLIKAGVSAVGNPYLNVLSAPPGVKS